VQAPVQIIESFFDSGSERGDRARCLKNMGTHLSRAAILTLASMLVTRPSAPCSRTPLPTPAALVDRAAVIVVATAVEYWRLPNTNGTAGVVEFYIEETLKGRVQSRDRQRTPLEPFRPELTPYWEALAPTNEQVHRPYDPWVVWVRRRLTPRF
jgi:hypothetical protein